MPSHAPEPFRYEGGSVDPGETEHFRFEVSEAYVSDPIRVPITVINGEEGGPTAFLTVAVHGNELNGIDVLRRVVDDLDHDDLAGTLVCVHVVNVPGSNVQERAVPAEDDLNRSFPGSEDGTTSERIARQVYANFIEPCDFGIDFHTSTGGRTNVIHARGDLDDPEASRLAHAFGTNLIVDGAGPPNSLRRAATEAGTPTIVVEMGEANRFQDEVIEDGVRGVQNVLAEFELRPADAVEWPGWRSIVDPDKREWLRADAGGIVDMDVSNADPVREGEFLCTIRNPFDRELTDVEAPFAGILFSRLENLVVYPGSPLCHIAAVDDSTLRIVETTRGAR